MPAAQRTSNSTTRSGRGRWIDQWNPEDPVFWARTGRTVAHRNLAFSVFAEHVGFSVWTLWSVMVLFMGPGYHIDAAGKFFLVAVPTLVGSLVRIPYSMGPARFGGRNWTIISAGLLLIPAVLAMIVMHPGTSYTTFVLVAAVAGVGGGNFASSMVNINAFFPEGRKGWALGLNAGGGNLGVAVVQLAGLLVIGTVGAASPRLVLGGYLPLIVIAALCAALRMDNVRGMSSDRGALREAVRDAQTWVMSLLYLGTFGSFIGYSFAFGLVLQSQFGRSPLQAAAVTFVGPLLGSLIRPVGGLLADRFGGAKVTLGAFVAMAASVDVVLAASAQRSLALYTVGFVALFVLSGLGNGSAYKMIPSIFAGKARRAIEAGQPAEAAFAAARRRSGAVIGVAGAVGALGGLFINLAFRASFQLSGSADAACWGFMACYGLCVVLTYLVYLRPVSARAGAPRPAYAEV